MSDFVFDKGPTIGTREIPGESWDMFVVRKYREERLSKKVKDLYSTQLWKKEKPNKMEPWGYHLTLDCKSCELDKIKSAENVSNFAKDLVVRIDMVPYGEPQVVHFGKEDKTGFTLVQLIETSNICGHFCDDSGDAYIDVFSCKPFNNDDVVACVKEYFNPAGFNLNFHHRQA